MVNKDKINLFYPEWQNVLMGIDGLTPTKYSYQYQLTYAHTHKIVAELIRIGACTSVKKGRETIISLTEFGSNLSELFLKTKTLLAENRK